MNKDIKGLNPQLIWKHFYALTQIPRPSGHEEASAQYVMNFAKEQGLEAFRDEVGNVIVRKPATSGMENRTGVVLQGHLDMVPQKNSDKEHDFEKDPIEAYIDGEWVTANGTTLGADNGMGVAASLAVLESKDIVHGPIEVLMTIDEETGMTGAFGLKGGVLKGDILLNLDSEDEGELYVGCAGGTNANVKFEYKEEAAPAGSVGYDLEIRGLKGGHSGMEIILQRGNSNKLMFRFLYEVKDMGVRVSYVDGGSLRNAIPRECFVKVAVPSAKGAEFESKVKEFEATFLAELALVDENMTFKAIKGDVPSKVMDVETQHKLTYAVYACPNGVARMSDSMEGLVETSNNLARVEVKNGEGQVLCLLRSSVDSAKLDLENQIASVFKLAGFEVWMDGQYPGWKPNLNSPILTTMQEVYKKMYGKVPTIKAIHAGLECGLLGGVYPNWDMISFGPTIRYPHSPDEKVKIDTVEKFWNFLVETLENVPVK
jgi:aminoacyl-histidine dipeptidase